ncbi:MAG: IPT/TIG domain-containing protein [Terracidiphilus sp.]
MITSLTPASAIAGGAASTLIINGEGFTATSTAMWGSTALTTTWKSASELTATVPASLIASAGTISITVSSASGTASAVLFTVNAPQPATASPVPALAVPDVAALPGTLFPDGNAVRVTAKVETATQPAAAVDASSSSAAIASNPAYIPPTLNSDSASVSDTPASTGMIATSAIAMTASAGGATPQAVSPLASPQVAAPPAPTVTSLSPASATAGGAAFTLTINGTNYTSTATANWGSTPLITTYKNATQLTAAVPATLIATDGTASVTVTTDSGTTSGTTFTINPARPTISSLSPTSVLNGTAAFTLTINGANFAPGTTATVVRWNSTVLATTYVSSTQLTAVVPANLIEYDGTTSISVVSKGGISSGVTFTINLSPPTITKLTPNDLPSDYGEITLMISGVNFTPNMTVNFGATQIASTTGGTVTIPASLTSTPGPINVTVTTSAGTSAPSIYTVALPLPVVTSISPASVPAGSAQFKITINGTGFILGSFSSLGTPRLATTYVSPTQLTAIVPASLVASAGVVGLLVYTPGANWSRAITFTIDPSPPTITSLSPNSIANGYTGVMMKVNGTAFTHDATVYWGTTPLDTIYLSSTQLSTCIPPSMTQYPGTGSVTVVNSVGTSAPAVFTINMSPPQIDYMAPGFASAGGAGFTLTLSGNNYTPAAIVKWGSTALATTYVSFSELTAVVPASLITNSGMVSISVTTAAGTSNLPPFIVNPAPKIITTTLPSGTAGNAYSAQITATGGVPGYDWVITGLPEFLTYNNTFDSTLTITGTAPTSGPVTFQVAAQDQFGSIAGPVNYTINFAAGPTSTNDGSLNGSYTCLFQGYFDDGSRWASVASFQADGQGNFSSGIFDTNSTDIGSGSGIMTGVYSVGSDNSGTASIHTIYTENIGGNQTTQWAIALTSNAQPAQQLRMVEDDDLGTLPSGQQATANCYLATPSAFSDSTISGSSFVFGVDGEDNSGNMKAKVGLFSAAAGKIVNGNLDTALGGNNTAQTTAFSGAYTAPDPASGRFTIALNGAGSPSGYTVYIIDANRMFILDNTSDDGEQSGNMRPQQQASYSGASIDGPYVLYLRGAEFSNGVGAPSGFYAGVFRGTGDGAGNFTVNQSYTNDDGVYSSGKSTGGPTALTFDPDNPGRATFSSASGTTYLYLFNSNTGFEMSVKSNGSVDSGWLEPQTQMAFTDAALAGNYLSGELPLLNWQATGSVGEYNLTANGAITGGSSTAGKEYLSWDQSINMTYGWDAKAPGTGTFIVANGAQSGASCAVINAIKFVCVLQTDLSPSIELMQQ